LFSSHFGIQKGNTNCLSDIFLIGARLEDIEFVLNLKFSVSLPDKPFTKLISCYTQRSEVASDNHFGDWFNVIRERNLSGKSCFAPHFMSTFDSVFIKA
jgi:hypothetical protein